MKTTLTLMMEKALYHYCLEQGAIVVEEVSMPEEQGIVDTLACYTDAQGNRQWRCFELKVSRADFRSKAKLSFIGHYNYFVLPEALYLSVREEIPDGIGVLVYRPYAAAFAAEEGAPGTFTIEKKPKRQELQVAEAALTNRFIASLSREVQKAKRMDYGPQFFSSEQLYKELKKRMTGFHVEEENYFDRLVQELESQAVLELQEEVAALKLDYDFLRNQGQPKRRATEPLE